MLASAARANAAIRFWQTTRHAMTTTVALSWMCVDQGSAGDPSTCAGMSTARQMVRWWSGYECHWLSKKRESVGTRELSQYSLSNVNFAWVLFVRKLSAFFLCTLLQTPWRRKGLGTEKVGTSELVWIDKHLRSTFSHSCCVSSLFPLVASYAVVCFARSFTC